MRCFAKRPTVAASLVCLVGLSVTPGVMAQPETAPGVQPERTDAELRAARALFSEALRDEQDKRFDVALEKFRRVRDVRDTAAIEYRIGTCAEGLGRPASALVAYRAAVTLGETESHAADVVRAARARADEMEKRVARVMVTLSSRAPSDADVRVDDVSVAPGALAAPIVIDPGNHVVTAAGKDATPFRTEITVPEGSQVTLRIPLDPPLPPPSLGPTVTPYPVASNGTRTAGWVTLTAGGVLVAGSVISLLLRQSDINKLNDACPNGQCNAGADPNDLTSTRSRALLEGPLAGVLGAVGAAAVGVGVYLVLRSPTGADAQRAALVPFAWQGGGGLGLRGQY